MLHPAVRELPPGEPPDLAALIGEGDEGAAGLLRALALDERPSSDPTALVRRLRSWKLERDIDDLRRRLDTLDPDQDPEKYSAMFAELIALERTKRELVDW